MVCTGTRGSPVEYVSIDECTRTLCDVRMAYLGGYMYAFILLMLSPHDMKPFFLLIDIISSTPNVFSDYSSERDTNFREIPILLWSQTVREENQSRERTKIGKSSANVEGTRAQ